MHKHTCATRFLQLYNKQVNDIQIKIYNRHNGRPLALQWQGQDKPNDSTADHYNH